MSRPLLLVDFDGVWTDPRRQADEVIRATEGALAKMAGLTSAEASAALRALREIVSAAPETFGWESGERISAYADEDPFLLHNATMAAADRSARAGDDPWKRILLAARADGHADLAAFGSAIFEQASQTWLEHHGHDLRPGAVETMDRLLERADVVVCTNFETLSVARTWRRHGLSAGSGARAALRVRGGARKQLLTADPPRSVLLAGRPVAVDRGHYARILREERPSLVAGDVLSLDLSVPLTLRREDPSFRDLTLLLVRTAHTPTWALDVVAQERPALGCIDGPAALLDAAETLGRPHHGSGQWV